MTHTRCNLKAVMRRHGIRQDVLADKIGCTQCQISRWANSYNYPGVGSVIDILTALEQVTGERFEVRDLWTVVAERVPLPNSLARHNAETSRVTRIAAQVRRRAA